MINLAELRRPAGGSKVTRKVCGPASEVPISSGSKLKPAKDGINDAPGSYL